jgi:acetyltransferase-like isoleucine patch superfamily enzyme/acyl carrier protein
MSGTTHSKSSDGRDAPSGIELDERQFIRHQLYGRGSSSVMARYAALVLSRPSYLRLLRYELLITFFGPIPGALGLALRRFFFPFLFASCGKGVIFGKSLTLRHPDNIHLGDGVVLDDYALLDARGAGEPGITLGDRVIMNRAACVQAKIGEISIGKECSIGDGTKVISQGPIYIENNVSIAGGCSISGGHYIVEVDESDPYAKRRTSGGAISIGRNVRMGMGALVLDGVSIGEGAIVAPGSVVINDVAQLEVVTGSPARPWRARSHAARESSTGTNDTKGTAKPSRIRERLIEYFENQVFVEFGPDGISESASFLDSGVLDSVGMVTLASWLTEEFGILINDQDVVPENLDSLLALEAFVERRLN